MPRLVNLEILSGGKLFYRLRCECDQAYIDGEGDTPKTCPKCGRRYRMRVHTEIEMKEAA